MCKTEVKRMHQPLDTLVKRQAVFIGDVFHEFHDFPGEYHSPLPNEFPNKLGAIPKIDMGYYVTIDGEFFIINNEDITGKIDEDVLLKSDNYKTLLEYGFDVPVISTITTIQPIEKCVRFVKKSETQLLRPIVYSYKTEFAENILRIMTNAIEKGKVLSKVEALNLILLPKRFSKNQREVVKKVCHLLKVLKVEDQKYKQELIFEMDCIIHYYAESLEEILELEKVIGLSEAKTAMEFYEESLINKGKSEGFSQGKSEGISQGRIEGSFKLALKIKKEFGIQKAFEMTDFSMEELENEKLNIEFEDEESI